MLHPGSLSQCYIILFISLPAWLLSAVFCNGLIQVDELPDPTQILANQQQQPHNSTGSFEGADYRTHFLNESYPDEGVVYFWNYVPFEANYTGSSVFRCNVIHPLIVAEQVYLQIFMTDNSTKIFTGGRRLARNESKIGGSGSDVWWQRQQYEFDVHFNVNMSRAACLGMDSNGNWRKHEDHLRFEYGYAPTLQSNISVENSNKLFVAGTSYMLECPFNLKRDPWSDVTWQLPSGKEKTGDCLLFTAISRYDAGQYTCIAKNKYGNGTYTLQVSVRDPTFLERLNRRLDNALRTILEPLGIFLFLIGYIQFPGPDLPKHFSCSQIKPLRS